MSSPSSNTSSLSFSASEYVCEAEIRTADVARSLSPFRASKIYIHGASKKYISNGNPLPAGGLADGSHRMASNDSSTTPKDRKIVKKFSLSALKAKLSISRSPSGTPRQQAISSLESGGGVSTLSRTPEREYCAEGERLRLLSLQRQGQQATLGSTTPHAFYGHAQYHPLRSSYSPASSPLAGSGPWMASPYAPFTSSPLAPTCSPPSVAQSVKGPAYRPSDPSQAAPEATSPWLEARGTPSTRPTHRTSRPAPDNPLSRADQATGPYSVAMEGDDIFDDRLPTPSPISPFLLSQSPAPPSPTITTPTEAAAAAATTNTRKRKGSSRNYYGARSGAQRESTRATWGGPTTSHSTGDLRHLFRRPPTTPLPGSPSQPLRASQSMASLRGSGPASFPARANVVRPVRSVNALGISYDPESELFIAEEEEEEEEGTAVQTKGLGKVREKRLQKERKEVSLEYHRSLNKMVKGYAYVPSV